MRHQTTERRRGRKVDSRWLRRASFAAAAVCGLVLATSTSLAAVDPFYDSLLREGRLAFERGEWATAAARLRLACFGLLDEPALLTEALSRLALAQERSGDAAGFRESVQRIVEVDDRFSTYTPEVVPADVRSDLEATITEKIPKEFLAAYGAFRHLSTERGPSREDLAALPAKRRKDALEERSVVDPENFRWPLLLAETELELGNLPAARQAAQRALDLDPGNQDALCARGRSRAGLDECELATPDLETCRKIYTDADYSLALLACQAELGHVADSHRLLDTLPEAIRDERRIRRFARRLPAASQTASPVEPASESPAAPLTPAVDSTPELAPDEAAALSEARALLRAARSIAAVEQALELARSVADAHLGHREAQHLVAEMAYRASRWQEAVVYFERGGIPGANEPRLLFYLAVAYWESGRPGDAAEALRRALPSLQRSAYVESYVERILGKEGTKG